MVKKFREIDNGDCFRFVGGRVIFVKVSERYAVVDEKPSLWCPVVSEKEVVPTGKWVNLQTQF